MGWGKGSKSEVQQVERQEMAHDGSTERAHVEAVIARATEGSGNDNSKNED